MEHFSQRWSTDDLGGEHRTNSGRVSVDQRAIIKDTGAMNDTMDDAVLCDNAVTRSAERCGVAHVNRHPSDIGSGLAHHVENRRARLLAAPTENNRLGAAARQGFSCR